MNTFSFFIPIVFTRIITGKSVIIRERDSAHLSQHQRIIQKAIEHFALNQVNYDAALIRTDAQQLVQR